ncbi:N-acetylmuramoyl-L-alanine amidase [Georgenia sp. AZ-5]|uniref:N-acetylmuramoyl-L-alanine amidase n=1 Tax=Georgenia sp. AZ-5 TaxID=3367526 RepID=UPI00375495C7
MLASTVDTGSEVAVAGVTWESATDPTEFEVYLRSSTDDVWSSWQPVDITPRPASGITPSHRDGTEPVAVIGADEVQVAFTIPEGAEMTGAGLTVWDPGTAPADDEADLTSTGASAPGATALPAATSAQPTIYSRADWGADESLMRWTPQQGRVTGVVVHHTAGNNNYTAAQVPGIIRGIYAYHAVTRGWGDIGYNVLVDKYGRAWEGRAGGLTKAIVGAHAAGYNSAMFGISVLGNYDQVPITEAAFDTLARVTGWKFALHGVNASGSTLVNGSTIDAVVGHRDVGQTSCPGRYIYSRLPELTQRIAGYARSYGSGVVVRGGMLAWYSQGDRASRLGDPVANERRVLDGVVQEFERGTVYMSPRSTWATLGSMDGLYGGPSSVLGWPAGDERSVRDGFVQRFEKGSLLVRPSGDWRTVGSIDVAFWRNGGPGGVLGFPTGEQSCSGGQCVQHFAGDRVYSAGSGGAVLRGGMLSWYLQGDRASRLGWPVADERRVLDGVVQEFERGTVYMSPRSTWATLGSMDGLYGGPSSVLGWPAGDERSVRDGFVQRFEKGSLLVRPSGDWRTVGSIDVAFWRNGGPGGVLGFPTGEQSCSGGQCVQHFAGGRVYSAGSGGAVLRGGMLSWYLQGDRASRLGWPVADERRVLDGVVQEFERGTVYMSPRSTWATLGSMDGLYGGPSSVLGWPAGDERSVRDGFVQRFEKGSLLVRPSGDWRTVGSIDVAFWRNGGPGGVLGFPTGEQSCSGGQCVQHFAGGRVYSAGSGGAVLRGGMLSWYLQGDRASRLGRPVADERTVAGGVIQQFERGTVHMTPASVRIR